MSSSKKVKGADKGTVLSLAIDDILARTGIRLTFYDDDMACPII
jgi:hypothetical protein